ncbi:MAG: arginine--tRNA ligase [Nanoarchaeota archaeon]|nr:arginine--tRNA ligase [Nanoarchaeota archaeon]
MDVGAARKEAIASALFDALKNKKLKLEKADVLKKIQTPPSPELGDYCFPCFFLASLLKEEPDEIALELRSNLKLPKGFKDVQTQGAYINFFIDREKLVSEIIPVILSKKEKFGSSDEGKNKKIMVEFSQANTHKAFHVGHIRGTSLGESLARIIEFSGSRVIRANYQGDSGMHVAKWIWCFRKYHAREKLKNDESWIASVYVDAVRRLERNKKLQEEVNAINKKLESGEDKELNELWKKTRELSLNSLGAIYKQLNTHFDFYYFEKDMEAKGKEIVESMVKKKFARKSEGAVIIDLQEYNLGIWVLIRQDGTILYSAKDLALAEKKFSEHPDLDNSLYVIASEQDFHFKQLVKTLDIIGFRQSGKLGHISYGVVRLPEGKMSSRTGNNILYSDFLEKVVSHAKKEIRKREKGLSAKELGERALKVSIAAIKYDMLKQDEHKNIIFDIKESLNFEGNSGPYIQYSYARARSILKKSKKPNASKPKVLESKEIELIKKLSEFPEIVSKAYNSLSPSYIANYAYQLSQVFNEFYHQCPVIKSKNEGFRLSLVESFMHVVKNSLYLLGIDVLERM